MPVRPAKVYLRHSFANTPTLRGLFKDCINFDLFEVAIFDAKERMKVIGIIGDGIRKVYLTFQENLLGLNFVSKDSGL